MAAPHVVVMDVGGTTTRVGVLSPLGQLVGEADVFATPTPRNRAGTPLSVLQDALLNALATRCRDLCRAHAGRGLTEVGVSLGAVVDHAGVVANASVLWHQTATGFDFAAALASRLPGMRVTVINDVSALAWRHSEEGRFCIITVSTGVGNKVFNRQLTTPLRLELDDDGLGGEMGHVAVDPDGVAQAMPRMVATCEADAAGFAASLLSRATDGDPRALTPTALGRAAVQGDELALHLLERAGIPHCECGNLADLCSYTSGPAVERLARRLARLGSGYRGSRLDVLTAGKSDRIDTRAIARAARAGDAFTGEVLRRGTRHLALRILQLAADLGLEKVLLTGGFAMGVGEPYLAALHDNLLRLVHRSGYFTGWSDERVTNLVRPRPHSAEDGLIGVGRLVQERAGESRAVVKPVGRASVALESRRRPPCGAAQILVRVLHAGVCSTDLQILRGQRALEPTVPGHECVAEVAEVGTLVRGLHPGDVIAINPNNPRDEDDKVGHSREGVFQDYLICNADMLDKGQIVMLHAPPRRELVLLEPLACVIHAQRRFPEPLTGRSVLVAGAGVMGILHLLWARARGARKVLLVNRSERKLRLAVERGWVHPGDALLLGNGVAEEVLRRTGGRGADALVIALAGDAGLEVTERLLPSAADGAAVCLFGGFLDRLSLPLEGGERIDCGEIRSRGLVVEATVAGKRLRFVGSRGSAHEDYVEARDAVRSGRLRLEELVTHVVSLEALPRVLDELRDRKTVDGRFALRVVVDLLWSGERSVPIHRLPLLELRGAARGGGGEARAAAAAGNRFAALDRGRSRLGWVIPPAWPEVEAALSSLRQAPPLAGKKRFVVCATGGWAHAIEVVRTLVAPTNDLRVVHSLDPRALAAVLPPPAGLDETGCIGITGSGRTLETRLLMDTLRERFDHADLDYRRHFLWLSTCDRDGAVSGAEQIRGDAAVDWSQSVVRDVTLDGSGDVEALFGAPHAVPFLLPLALLLPRREAELVWEEYLRHEPAASERAAEVAQAMAGWTEGVVRLALPAPGGSALERWTLQLIRQSLVGKRADYRPTFLVDSAFPAAADRIVDLGCGRSGSPLVDAMLHMRSCQILSACLAYRHDLDFLGHPEVARYKEVVASLLRQTDGPGVTGEADEVTTSGSVLERWLSRDPEVRLVEVVAYRRLDPATRRRWEGELSAALPGRSFRLFEGSDWNHHSYQAAVGSRDTRYVLLAPDDPGNRIDGVSVATLRRNLAALEAIAVATHRTLGPRSFYLAADGLSSLTAGAADRIAR